MGWKTLDEMDLDGKRVLVRVDINVPVENGQFGADMAVSLVNDGPVTIWMDTDQP